MQLHLLNNKFETISLLNDFISAIWTERFDECGDFEIVFSISKEKLTDLNEYLDKFLYYEKTKYLMIIESVEIEYDNETGYSMMLKGRCLASLLSRRIVWGKRTLSGNLQDNIEILLNENIINPTDSSRKINNFRFIRSMNSEITSLTIDDNYDGNNILDTIISICQTNKIGFRVTFNDDMINDIYYFDFELYTGVDRTASQYDRPHIMFTTTDGSILNSNYSYNIENLKNVVLVSNDTTSIVTGYETGMSRREIHISDSSTDNNILQTRGEETLKDNKAQEVYDIESSNDDINKNTEYIISNILYTNKMSNVPIYNDTYFLGDIVETEMYIGTNKPKIVKEFIYSYDESGFTCYPTIVTKDENETTVTT